VSRYEPALTSVNLYSAAAKSFQQSRLSLENIANPTDEVSCVCSLLSTEAALINTVRLDCHWLLLTSHWVNKVTVTSHITQFPQCSDTVGWATGRASGLWKRRVLVWWWWQFDWSSARLIAAVVTTTSIILSSSKIQSGDVLVPANPDQSGKWLWKLR